MKKIGLYFGSFNPITIGHMIVAQESLIHVDEVWFVLSPHNPHKEAKDLLDEYCRYELLLKAVSSSNNPSIKVCNVEFDMERPSYTHKTLGKLKELHPKDKFHIITGTDAFLTVPTWKKGVDMLKDTPFIIVKRGEKDDFMIKEGVDVVIEGYSTMSATVVREKIKSGTPFGLLVPHGVEEIILEKGYYKKLT